MKKIAVVLATLLLTGLTGGAQTLFTYGNHAVTTEEFLRAYRKNNTNTTAARPQSVREYLDLYIRSRLKIQEAYDRGYDTLPQIRTEVENLRVQIIDNYINDPQTLDQLVREAFTRSQKDIHVAHIFIGYRRPDGSIDTAAAYSKAQSILARLRRGEDFMTLAQQYSEDPSARTNRGDIGFITVFSLPYEIENLAYSTPVGHYSTLGQSSAGFHIIKNLGERKAIGKIRAQQILLAFPPDADEATRKQLARRADSLYARLLKGDDMAKLAGEFSNDYISANSGGVMPNFGTGQYDPAFEAYVLGLPGDGVPGKPFRSRFGYHIVRRLGRVPVVTDPKNQNNLLLLRSEVQQSDRMAVSRRVLYDKVLKAAGFSRVPYKEFELGQLTDSLIDFAPPAVPVHMTRSSVLFRIGDSSYTVNDWVNYAQTFRFRADGSGRKPYNQVMKEFIAFETEQYYRQHLEQFNPEFHNQMKEFLDGNLFFEIMQREVWTRAQNDTAALQAYYDRNRSHYTWDRSADAVVFFCSDTSTASLAYNQVRKDPDAWKKTADALSEKVVADSARYEWNQLPGLDKSVPRRGQVTSPVINKADNTASFAYIIQVYPQPAPRSFEQARGLVINDYQNQLDEQWVAELKKKYPVTINQQELKRITK
ncbi:MAG TPA: peptidylprolyl isomerase [Chitinophagaceae bacterium]|nr:peptidylprolyl isomerase [Chitinophagaceae bacterium]